MVKYIRFFMRGYLFTLLAAIFVGLYWNSAAGLPEEAIRYPLIITYITIFFILWNVYISIVEFRKIAHLDVSDKHFNITFKLDKPKLVVIGSTILYGICIPILGYVVSTFIFLAALAFYLGSRKPAVVVLYAAGLTGFFYVIFRMWLGVRLPTGMFI